MRGSPSARHKPLIPKEYLFEVGFFDPMVFSRKAEISRFGAICGALRPCAASCLRSPVARNGAVSRVSVISGIRLDFYRFRMYLISSLVEISSCAQGLKSTREKLPQQRFRMDAGRAVLACRPHFGKALVPPEAGRRRSRSAQL